MISLYNPLTECIHLSALYQTATEDSADDEFDCSDNEDYIDSGELESICIKRADGAVVNIIGSNVVQIGRNNIVSRDKGVKTTRYEQITLHF